MQTSLNSRFQKVILALAVSTAFAAPAAAQETSRISRITLYPGSATVERTSPVAPGVRKLEMTGLPANFDLRTLRVEAGSGVQIGEVSIRDVSRADALSAREAALEAQIQALKDQRAAIDVEVKTAELVRDYLATLTTRPEADEKVRPAPVDPKNIPAILEAIRRGGTDAYGTVQKAEIKRRAIDKQTAVIERELAKVRSGARDVRTLVITYAATTPSELRASYQVQNAGWKPAYRASLDSQGSKIEIERQAQIIQRTGEDWRGVALRLSTGQPRPAQLIDPAPWQLQIAQQIRERDHYNAMQAPASAGAKVTADLAQRLNDGFVQVPAQFHSEYTTEFEVAGKVDLAADGRQVTVSLAREKVAAKQRVRVVPRAELAAMVTAEAVLPEGVWIPGDVQLYRDGNYVGQTYWQAAAKEKLELPFGRDDRVQVAVKRVKSRTGTAGFASSRNERQIADLYTVTSRHKVPVELLLLEASPVGVSDDIKVETAFEPKPKTANWQDQRGVMAWEQPLVPGQTLKVTADYTITYPKNLAIVGLP